MEIEGNARRAPTWSAVAFEAVWSYGAQDARTVGRQREHGRHHIQKYFGAAAFGRELAPFWGDYSAYESRPGETPEETVTRLGSEDESRPVEAERSARDANIAKQAGFYVDRDEHGHVLSPSKMGAGTVEADLQRAAQVVEMLLIKDHTWIEARGRHRVRQHTRPAISAPADLPSRGLDGSV